MGGDDLDDFEYLAPVEDTAIHEDDQEQVATKRKRDDGGEKSGGHIAPSPEKKAKRKWRTVAGEMNTATAQQQADFLTKWTEHEVMARHLCGPIKAEDDNPDYLARITQFISKKKLKTWNLRKSPSVIIVCLSARRAVQILKELAPSRLRVAKLFAKHMTVSQQETMLTESTFPIAVGTPHRLLQLSESGHLSASKSKLVVLDAHVNPKNFTVCTLPDTEPYLKDYLSRFVLPNIGTKSDLRIAFL